MLRQLNEVTFNSRIVLKEFSVELCPRRMARPGASAAANSASLASCSCNKYNFTKSRANNRRARYSPTKTVPGHMFISLLSGANKSVRNYMELRCERKSAE